MAVSDVCALLDRLCLEPGESPWLEFKASNGDPQLIGEYISALANGAILSGKDRAFIVFGVDNKTRAKIGTEVRLHSLRVGGEGFENWISRLLQPALMVQMYDFECDGKSFSIIELEPTYERPVRFSWTEYIRIGEHKKKLSDFPEHERSLWLATGRRRFERGIAKTNVSAQDVLKDLSTETVFELLGTPRPKSDSGVLEKLTSMGFIVDNLEGRFDITNLGAILLANDVTDFPTISSKATRVIKYKGRDKSSSEFEREGKKGYAVGFSGLIDFLMERLPAEEKYISGIRRMVPVYPETAVRELIANALIHQDFTITGAGPVIEIFENRVEISNPGNSLISADRLLDERRSRNERLAEAMRAFGLCEERGGGIDKTVIEIEAVHLPAPDFISSETSMRVVLFGPRSFNELSKADKMRACFFHCVMRWMKHDYMSNSSLRDRFSLEDKDYQAVSAIISESVRDKRIAPADPNQGKRNARYVPYWAS